MSLFHPRRPVMSGRVHKFSSVVCADWGELGHGEKEVWVMVKLVWERVG